MQDWLKLFGTYDPTSDNTTGYDWVIKTNDKSLVVSILSAGTFFGALLSNPIASILGRKWGLVFSCLIFSLGVGLQLDTHWATFIVGRVIAGLGGTFIFPIRYSPPISRSSQPPLILFPGFSYPPLLTNQLQIRPFPLCPPGPLTSQ